MGYIGKIQDTAGNTHLIGSTLYGTCSTAADTVTKEVVCNDFNSSTIPTGLTLRVKFTYGNVSSTVSLKLGTLIYGISAPNIWSDGDIVAFTFNGTSWQITGGIDSTRLPLAGGTMTGDIVMGNNYIRFGNGRTDAINIQCTNDGKLGIQNKSTELKLDQIALDITSPTITIKSGAAGSNTNIVIDNTKVDVKGTIKCTRIESNASTPELSFYSGATSIVMGTSNITISAAAWTTGSGTAAYITNTSGANKIVKYSSSRRYKDNINYEIDKEKYHEDLLKFKPCRFNYKTEPGLTNLGLIAEDVEEINPELCNFEGDKVESFKDRDLLVMCILELQRKDKEINELKSRLESLELRNRPECL